MCLLCGENTPLDNVYKSSINRSQLGHRESYVSEIAHLPVVSVLDGMSLEVLLGAIINRVEVGHGSKHSCCFTAGQYFMVE